MKKIFNFSYSIISFFFILSCKKDGITQEKLIYLNKNTKLNSLIQWVPCEKKILNEDRNPITLNLECGTINVPLNWDKFDGKKINLSFIRSKAKNDLKRIGTLIVNNRGPGSESIKLANYMSTHSIYKDIAEHFDIIGMDPRGVGESTPIKCTKEWNGNFSFPKNEIEFNELLNENGNYYDSCLEGSGEILNYVDTTIVARDLEALRFALGNEKLNFFGYSYGAVIASKYAELFPENSRALIMDGIFDHSQENALDFAKTEVNAAEKNLSYFSEWCDNNPDCKLPNESILNAFDKMIKETNEHPLVLNGNKKINGVQIQSNTQRYLTLGKVFWPNLANAIKEIVNGNADKFGLFYSSLFFK